MHFSPSSIPIRCLDRVDGRCARGNAAGVEVCPKVDELLRRSGEASVKVQERRFSVCVLGVEFESGLNKLVNPLDRSISSAKAVQCCSELLPCNDADH